MSFSDLFTLNNPIAARLVRILYVVMLALVAIAVVAGVARGIATMARPQGPRITIVRPAPPPPAPQVAAPAPAAAEAPTPEPAAEPATAAPATAAQTDAAPAPEQRITRREMRERGFGPRFERRGGGGRNAVLVGTLRVVGSLVAGAIAFMVLRILAEMALAVLKLGERKEA